MLPLTKLLKNFNNKLLHLWYTDDAKAAGKFDDINIYFKKYVTRAHSAAISQTQVIHPHSLTA